MTRHGLPTASTCAGTFLVTTLPAPMTVESTIVTPAQTMTPAASHTLSPTSVGDAESQPLRRASWSSTG
jgi:hypothetical protein